MVDINAIAGYVIPAEKRFSCLMPSGIDLPCLKKSLLETSCMSGWPNIEPSPYLPVARSVRGEPIRIMPQNGPSHGKQGVCLNIREPSTQRTPTVLGARFRDTTGTLWVEVAGVTTPPPPTPIVWKAGWLRFQMREVQYIGPAERNE